MRFLIMVLLYVVLNVYIGWHGAFALKHFDLSFPGYWVVFWVIALGYLFGRFRLLPGAIGRFCKLIGSYYFAVMEFALILLPIADLVAWVIKANGNTMSILIVTVVAVFILLLVRGSWNAWNPIVRTHTIHVDKQAGNMKELRIAVASDLHLGDIVGNRHLDRLVQRMNALQPDLILFPGDMIDDVVEPFIRKGMASQMKQLRAKYGMYAVLGNHEYYGGQIEAYIKQMQAIGIPVLQDEKVWIDNAFYVVGRKDKTAEAMEQQGRVSVEELVQDVNHNFPIIMMDHQPYHFDKAAAAGVDLLLCGHTHRGQFTPNHWITGRLFELDWGYMKKQNMHVAVSSGYGTWGPPIRLGSRSEILEIVVTFS